MSDTAEKIHAVGWWTISFAVLGTALFGFGSCVARDWRFENACRAQGGFVANASGVASGGRSTNSACVKVTQPAIVQPVALPEYKP